MARHHGIYGHGTRDFCLGNQRGIAQPGARSFRMNGHSVYSVGHLFIPVLLRGAMADVQSRRPGVPWLVWANVIASFCISAGLYWDISWHETIGRDTFWTPAHLVVQFGAILAAFGSAWLIMRTTFGGDAGARANSVSVLGFRAPLGAFVSAWGGVAMVTSAPFDNWWHEANGLDVKIISPPHVLLALGIAGIMWGGAILCASYLNRAEGPQRETLVRILLVIGG